MASVAVYWLLLRFRSATDATLQVTVAKGSIDYAVVSKPPHNCDTGGTLLHLGGAEIAALLTAHRAGNLTTGVLSCRPSTMMT